ncbi:hypothetical protein [uncultured Campylobacter sp.]|uniref:hypothetical protein n=1 Tax=uncultured Campylobacter sp. TaxID=218934 RepID=UPI00262A9D67|nr:hypothetical protein [uncultured Campylobacter sp.]
MMMPASPDASSYPHGAPSLSTGALLRSVYVRKRKICLLPIQRIHSNAKFNHELRHKEQEPSKAPNKILRRKIKIGSHKLAQKPDLEAKFSARPFKKAAI